MGKINLDSIIVGTIATAFMLHSCKENRMAYDDLFPDGDHFHPGVDLALSVGTGILTYIATDSILNKKEEEV